MIKSYKGNPPSEDEGWRKVWLGQCVADKTNWIAYAKPQDHTPDWVTYKIVADGRADLKANYWLVRNIKTKQIGFARDFVLLREHRPDLHEQIELMLDGF